ncbi:MAG TPA: hypothetical protein VFS34_07230, partial [Thermoanaerobaculia bacterium]|nr:hypothetical protein [Thermoanaerobaculia bacterium]
MKFSVRSLLAVLMLGAAVSARADIHFGIVEDSDDHHYYRSSGLASFEVRYEGEVELSPDRESVTAVAPGAWIEIRTRRLFSPRMVRVTRGADGRPQVRYWIADRSGSADQARNYLARNLPEAARVTAVGARGEAKRLLRQGPDRLLDAIGGLESGAAQEIYLEELVAAGPIDAAAGRRAVETAGREISSSSRLRRILTRLAEALPPDPDLTAALARACSEISSSSQSGAALAAIAEKRGVPPAAARDYAHSIGEISSSSEAATAVDRVGRFASDAGSIELLAGAAESIASSAELRRALTSLSRHPGLPPEALARILTAGARISSSSEKASLLEDCAAGAAAAPAPHHAYLATAHTIESSSETRRALAALVRDGVKGDALAEVLRAARRIDSSSQKAELLVEAAGSSSDPLSFTAYLECARTIDSSSEKGRAIRTLLEKANLTADQRKSVMDFAER